MPKTIVEMLRFTQYEKLKRFYSQVVQVDNLLIYHRRQEVVCNQLKSKHFSAQDNESTCFTNKSILQHLYMPSNWYVTVKFKTTLYATKSSRGCKQCPGIRWWCGRTTKQTHSKSLNCTIWNVNFMTGELDLNFFLKKLPPFFKRPR